MGGSLRLLQIVLPVFLVMASGYAMRRWKILTEEADQSLLGVLIKLFIPCLALDVIIGNEALVRPANLIAPPLAGFLTLAASLGIAIGGARIFFGAGAERRTFACATGLQNYGYIPLPLCQALFGREGVGVLFAFNLGVELAMWTLAVMTVAGRQAGRRWWEPLLNPPVVAVVSAILLNLAGAATWTPETVRTACHMLGVCAVPLGLLLSGALLADYATPHVLRAGWKQASLAVALRLGVLPLVFLGTAFAFPANPSLRAVLVVQAAMPSAVFSIVLAKLHGGDVPTAIRIVLATALAGIVTIPLWLAFGLKVFF